MNNPQSNLDLISRHQTSLTLNYGKLPAALVRAQGSTLTDADGKTYVDLFAGFGGTILGHAHPALVAAVTQQAQSLWATGNQFYSEPQIRLAEAIQRNSFDGRAFFCHSGAEANEAAIKLARLTSGVSGGAEGRFKIISMLKGFHGRTLGALAATATLDYQKGFGPMPAGFSYVPYDDLAALEAAIDSQTAAVLVEPIQGEGGINMPSPNYLAGVRALCDQHQLCLIFDEVWTGCGRTGRMFAHQFDGVTPDIMTLGKALGGGLPVGCMFAIPQRAALLKPGMHGCTLGGNPLCAAVAATVLETIEHEHLAQRAARLGDLAISQIKSFSSAAKIKNIRGRGLFLGIELVSPDGSAVVTGALARGVVVNVTQKNVLRICPALTIDEAAFIQALDSLDAAIAAA